MGHLASDLAVRFVWIVVTMGPRLVAIQGGVQSAE